MSGLDGLGWPADPVYFPCRCPRCGWQGMSNQTEGGDQIADTGDYNDIVCPICIAPGGNYENGHWIPVEEIELTQNATQP